uniref:Uncharacterized protein n=1 Tax=Glossina austeni TaxID=7395 RepID=A0A1A9VNG2_GLOAU
MNASRNKRIDAGSNRCLAILPYAPNRGQHWYHYHYYRYKHGSPKCEILHSHRKRADIRAAYYIIIEIIQNEIPNQTSPNGYMIKNCPIREVCLTCAVLSIISMVATTAPNVM